MRSTILRETINSGENEMARKSIEEQISEIEAKINQIKSDAKDKVKALEEKLDKMLSKKSKDILELIKEAGLDKLSPSEIKEKLSKLKL